MRSITRSEYSRKRSNGTAGPRSEMLEATQATWPAPHWALQLTDRGTALVPVEIVG